MGPASVLCMHINHAELFQNQWRLFGSTSWLCKTKDWRIWQAKWPLILINTGCEKNFKKTVFVRKTWSVKQCFFQGSLVYLQKYLIFQAKTYTFSQKKSVFLTKNEKNIVDHQKNRFFSDKQCVSGENPCISDKHCLSAEKQCFSCEHFFQDYWSFGWPHIAKQCCLQEKPRFSKKKNNVFLF